MKEASEARYSPLEEGITLLIPLPDFNRSKSDPRNLTGTLHTAVSQRTGNLLPSLYTVQYFLQVLLWKCITVSIKLIQKMVQYVTSTMLT